MTDHGYRAAQAAYDAREPAEYRGVAISPTATLRDLDALLYDLGVVRVTIARDRRGYLRASVETRDADGDGCARASSPTALTEALSEALGEAVTRQRAIDAEEADDEGR